MKINDAHCHYGWESFAGTHLRRKFISKLEEKDLKTNLDTYNIEKIILFAQPLPVTSSGYYSSRRRFLTENKVDVKRHYDKCKDVDYTKTNWEISELEDARIEFVPFVSSKTDPSYLDRFENIKGVKFYEPDGDITPKLLDYLNDRELNLIIHNKPRNEESMKDFLRYVDTNPGINFQFAHYGQCLPGVIHGLKEFDNLYIDSAASTDSLFNFYNLRPYFKAIAGRFSHKLLFGSDEPWANTGDEIKMINSFGLGKGQEEDIFYRNFQKIWK